MISGIWSNQITRQGVNYLFIDTSFSSPTNNDWFILHLKSLLDTCMLACLLALNLMKIDDKLTKYNIIIAVLFFFFCTTRDSHHELGFQWKIKKYHHRFALASWRYTENKRVKCVSILCLQCLQKSQVMRLIQKVTGHDDIQGTNHTSIHWTFDYMIYSIWFFEWIFFFIQIHLEFFFLNRWILHLKSFRIFRLEWPIFEGKITKNFVKIFNFFLITLISGMNRSLFDLKSSICGLKK